MRREERSACPFVDSQAEPVGALGWAYWVISEVPRANMIACSCALSTSRTKGTSTGRRPDADEHATKAITDSLNRIMRQIAVDWGIPATTELHGHPIFHNKEDWKHVPTRVRVGVFHKVFEALLAEDVVILLRWVHAARLAERQARTFYPVNYPAEQVCFQHILQRAQQVSVRRDTHTLIIADDRHDRDRHRERFATYQTEGTPGVYMQTNLDRLLDTVHFAPSHMSRMLQAADILAFIYRRVHTVTESDPRAAREMAKLWKTLVDSGRVHNEGNWP